MPDNVHPTLNATPSNDARVGLPLQLSSDHEAIGCLFNRRGWSGEKWIAREVLDVCASGLGR